ncbi:MAG: O-antigen ligase family protein [Flavobacteriales bacterium]
MGLKAASISENILAAGLIITLASLPWSPFGTSFGTGLIALAWVVSAVNRSLITPTNKLLTGAMAGLYVWHVVGLLWTDNLSEGLMTLQIKLPILIVTTALMTIRWDQNKWLPRILSVFVFSISASAIAGLMLGWRQISAGVTLHSSEWSPFISHIRMGILLSLGWGGLLIYSIKKHRLIAPAILYAVIAVLYIWQTQSVTGCLMFLFATFFGMMQHWMKHSRRWVLVVGAAISFLGVILLVQTLRPSPQPAQLATHTEWGAPYTHHQDRFLDENGYKVWNFLAWDEARIAWNKRSDCLFDGPDKMGHSLKITLTRYLTSLNLPKDGLAVQGLTEEDIRAIEQGTPSAVEHLKSGMNRRLDVLRYEVGNWMDDGNPSGNSVTQRWVYLKTGLHIALNNGIVHSLLGVGTGDLPDAYQLAYIELDTPLNPQFRKRTHNQYLAWWVASGFIALSLWILVLIASWKRDREWWSLGRLAWWMVVVSCFAEDTLETQAGVTFAVFALVLFSMNDSKERSSLKPDVEKLGFNSTNSSTLTPDLGEIE